MNKNLFTTLAFIFSIIALVISFYTLNKTGGLDKLKSSLLQLEFKMETRRYLLEAKAHLIEAKALYNFKKKSDEALTEIQKAQEFLGLAKLTATTSETKKIEQIHNELSELESKIKTKQTVSPNFIDGILNFFEKFFEKPSK